ncbi:MAG: amidohydrolase family protein [Myxococcota bacterium]
MFFHGLPARPRYRLFLAAFLVVSGPLVGCGGDDDSRPIVPDGGTDGAVDGDAGGGNMMPGCMPPGTPEPTVQMCPGDSLPSLPNGACEVTPGNEATLITGDILVPGSVLRGGQVLIDESGSIACVDCDCSAMAGGATQVVCPDGVVSPGLINTHEHITFAQNVPFQPTDERWEHRHDWRRGLRGHSELDSMGRASSLQVSWGELRMMMGGATSLNGSGSADGFLRNLDRSAMEGLGQTAVEYDTFPLGDSDGTLLAMGCGYPGSTRGDEIAMEESYTPHLSEGIDTEAQNEFLCAREGEFDLIQPQTALIHGIGLTPPEIGEIAADQSSLIWSPRSNISLYGDTARITEYASLGVSIALGTDWVISGSMNMVRELACAADLNELYYGSYFTDEELWLMATRNAAEALAVDDVLGTIAVGSVADLAIFRSQDNRRDHRAIIESQAQDVVLVMRSGRPLYGDETLLTGFAGGDTCDGIDVCGSMKRICAQSEIGASLTDLQNANGSSYPLFFCGEPMNEPTCVPARNAMGGGIPSPEVNGSNRYSGAIEDGDGDGDGIPDATDNCQCTFNPIRPLDNGVQADFDGDGAGDACDPCPLDMGLSGCSPPDPNDRDGDGVPNDTDNCPSDQNANQADADNDMKGDVCDACPMDPNPGQAACPGTIYDVKDGTLVGGTTVALTGPIVTGVGGNGFFMQVGPMDPV